MIDLQTCLPILLIVIAVTVSIPIFRNRSYPMDSTPVPKPEPVVEMPYERLNIRSRVGDVDQFVQEIATSKPATTLSDQAVLRAVDEIVNNPRLTNDDKYILLDALDQKVMNYHPHGMGAEVREIISNESICVQFPAREWHGRHGDWNSVRRQ